MNISPQEIKDLRHRLHASAELSHQESLTQSVLLEFFGDQPNKVMQFCDKKSLYLEFGDTKLHELVIFRADLDALPIDEAHCSLKYKSQNKGVSHKCGHDGHMAIAAMLAHLYSQTKRKKRLGLLFQHAEELGEGAKEVCEDRDFKGLRPSAILGLHNIPTLGLGKIEYARETLACASTGLKLSFQGKTSHAAHPAQALNPYPLFAPIVEFAKARVQPEENDTFFLCTLTHLKLGDENYGITPGSGELGFTLRSKKQAVLDTHCEHILNQAKKRSSELGLELSYEWIEPFPELRVDSKLSKDFEGIDCDGVSLIKRDFPYLWSEDFGHYKKIAPCFFFGLGIGGKHDLHHRDYDFNDDALEHYHSFFEKFIQVFC